MHICNHSTLDRGGGGSAVQGHPWATLSLRSAWTTWLDTLSQEEEREERRKSGEGRKREMRRKKKKRRGKGKRR